MVISAAQFDSEAGVDHLRYTKCRCLLCGATIECPSDMIGTFKICGKCEGLPEAERRALARMKPALNRSALDAMDWRA